MQAYLLAQPAGVDIGGGGEEEQPETRRHADLECDQVSGELANRREVTDEGQRGGQAYREPEQVFGGATQQFAGRPWGGVELDALVAIAFGDFLGPHEYPGPGALRAGVAAPDATGQDGDEEQAEGGDDQQRRQQDEVLRPEGRAENVELLGAEVPEHRLATIPVQP